jgi:murein L,D-transpeptidase YcbB/YkuD
MNRKEEQTVTLKEPIPVHIGYWTAWVNADGSVTYVDDPYGLDRKQASGFRLQASAASAQRP